jgi:hypothetical protein
MNIKKTLLTAAAAATLLVSGATAASADYRDRDRDYRGDNSWAERHDCDGYRDNRHFDRKHCDRYGNRNGYRRYVDHYRVYDIVRAHHYRYIGEPYFYRGIYVIRAYDPYGRVVLVRIDPYSGAWGGIYLRF